jgi:endoglucanase
MFRLSVCFVAATTALFSGIGDAALAWGKGTNLGNTLDAPVEGSWAPAAQEVFFDDFKSKGFEAIRIPVRWDNHTMLNSPYTIDSTFMNRVKTVVGWCLDRQFTCAINSHHDDWLDDQNKFPSALPRFVAIWTQISETFASYPSKLLFEIYNEPHVMSVPQLNQMNTQIYSLIRKTNPSRVVMFGSLGWYGIWWILQNPDAMVIPGGGSDPNVWLQVHDYDPFCFTTPQCGSPMITTWGTPSDIQQVKDNFQNLLKWASSRMPHTPILLGEFGATVQQPCSNCRSVWYQTYVAALQSSSQFVGWALWDDDGWFKVYDRANRGWDNLVLKAVGM